MFKSFSHIIKYTDIYFALQVAKNFLTKYQKRNLSLMAALTLSTLVDPVNLYVGDAANVKPIGASGGTAPYTYSISPSIASYGLTFSSAGTITGTPTTGLSASSFNVSVVDSASSNSNKTFVLSIAYHTPITSTVSQSVSYGATSVNIPLSVQYTYTTAAVVSGASHGTATASGSTISYTPTAGWTGTDSFTYRVTGPGGTSNISTVNITISTANVTITPTIASGSLQRGITSVATNPVTFNATGGQSPYTFSITSGQLPAGLTFTSPTISGTPTTAGTFNFGITTTDSSLPTHLTTVTNYSMNVLSLESVAEIVTTQKSSKYKKTSDYWNKSPLTVTPEAVWDQWGLYRSYLGNNPIGWGSDSIQDTNGTVDIPYSGSNVDVVIIALGSPDPNHPEFAVNPDGTGGSRVKYYNWLADIGGQYSDNGYRNPNANAAAAVASIVAGNTYGWARNANIYSIDLSLMSGIILPLQLVSAFKAVAKFHTTKLPNPVTGLQNPTIVICNQNLTYDSFTATSVTSVTYNGVIHAGPFTTATLATYHINSPFTSLSTSTSYQNNAQLYFNISSVVAAVNNCTKLPGLVFVGGAGDFQGYIDVSTGPNYNDTATVPSIGTLYYSQGSAPSSSGINVGAADSASVETIASYSAVGPGVSLYAPGSDIMAAFNSGIGVTNPYYPDITLPTTHDPRNGLYSIGKVSGTAYAAAQVAGFLACLAQVKPDITQASALSYLKNNAGINQLSTGSYTVSKGTTNQLYSASSDGRFVINFGGVQVNHPTYGSFLNTYGVWTNADLASPGNSTPVETTLFFTVPSAGNYTLRVSADNELRVYVNGSPTAAITSIDSYGSSESVTISLTSGINTLRCVALNYGNPSSAVNIASFGVVVQDLYGNHIFETSANLPVNPVPTSTPVNNLYFFGKFPNIKETVTSSLPAVATNQPFSITVAGGVSNSAFYFKGKDLAVGTNNFTSGNVNNDFSGIFTITNQVFTTPGIKTYDFYFANSTDRVTLSVEVIAHESNKTISSYTQSGKLWNKTHDYIPPNKDWLNWGLLRSSTTTNALNWGSDNVIVNTTGTITVPYAGLNVDIVVIDSSSIDPAHPEFALYSDGTGGSRVKYYNWTGSYPTTDLYNTTDANRVSAIASVAAGNTYGWARAANIYSLNYTLLPAGPQTAEAFSYVSQFHAAKAINPVTGYKNPTIIIAAWTTNVSISPGGLVHYRGTDHNSVTSRSDFNQYGLIEPYAELGIDNNLYLNVRVPVLDDAVDNAVNTVGITVVGIAGDNSAYIASDSSDPNWNNYYIREMPTRFYYHQGASPSAVPGVICVGALDSEVEQHKAPYSGNGPRVDLFAPGSDQMVAFSNSAGVFNYKTNSYTPTVADSRNSNYYVGKDSSTAYAAANVAGYIACLLQTNPTLTPADALSTVTQYASVNQMSVNIEGYGINKDLNGANNLVLYSVFPEYNENIITTVHNSTVTSVALGQYFNIVITNGSPNSYFTYSGSVSGTGQLDANGSATINTFALVNTGEYVYRFYFPLTNHSFTLKFKVQPAQDVTTSNIIYADDFDRIQNRVKYLVQDLYGKTPYSTIRSPNTVVTATSWTNLYKDIENAYIHQNNQPITLLTVDTSTRITAQEVNSLTGIVDDLITNFDQAAPQQLTLVNTQSINTNTNNVYDSYVRTYHWTTSTSVPNAARNFFNLGGYVKVNFSNPYLGDQTGYFTLTDYISGSGSISLPIPGGNVISKLSIQGINGNTATVQTIIAPNLGNIALATGTVQIYASTNATGGIAAPVPFPITDAPLAQGQLIVNPVSQYITVAGNNVTSYNFTVRNTSPTAITVTKINVIDDVIFDPLNTTINTSVPFTVPARVGNVDGTTTLSVSYQNVTPGGIAGLHNNALQLISDGVNPVLDIAVPIVTKFGIAVNPLNLVATHSTSATIVPVAYAGTLTSYTARINNPATGLQIINPGSNYTYFTLDDTPGKLTMGRLLVKELFKGLSIPSTTGAIQSPFNDPILVVDVASIPNKTTSTQMTVTGYNGANIGTYTTTISVTPNVTDKHLGHWLSPQNKMNGVIGFSYDIINGERCLTYGFGMGGGGSVPLYQSDELFLTSQFPLQGYGIYSSYAIQQLGRKFQTPLSTGTISTSIAGWNTGTTNTSTFNTSSQISIYSPRDLVNASTSTHGNAFLQTYGIWSGVSSTATHYVSTSSFLVRNAATYNYFFDCDSLPASNSVSSLFKIDNITINTATNVSKIKSGYVNLSAGLHNITIDSTQTGGLNTLASVALTLVDEFGYVVWCTLDPMPPTWSEIGRIILPNDNVPHTHQLLPNTYTINLANKTSYATYFENNSIVTVHDNGLGQLSISLNKVIASSRDSITDATLTNVPYLFYYASNGENQANGNKRFNNYQTVGQYVRYFTGFDPYGNVTTKNVLAPGYIAPPTIITEYYNNSGGGDSRPLWEQIAIDLLVLAIVGYAIFFAIAAYTAITLGGVGVGYIVWSTVAEAAAADFIEFLIVASCFTGDSKVKMADGTVREIKDVKAGEYVYNFNSTKLNKVKYVEITAAKELIGLYSPDKDIAPFATLNHPLYVDGKLSSLAPKEIYEAYPWLGITNKITAERSGPMHPGELMYNLYLDGDNTYIVNGYGTNSIIGDGGALRVAMEHGYLTQERVQEMFNEYIDEGTDVAFGGYLFNKYFGKLLETIKLKFVVKLAARAFDQPKESKFRQRMNKIFKSIGTLAIKRQLKQLNK